MTATPNTNPSPLGDTLPGAGPTRFSPVDPLRLFRQHTRLLIVMAIVGMFTGGVTYVVWRLFFPEFTTIAYLVVTPSAPGPWLTPQDIMTTTNQDAMQAYIQNQVIMLRSDSVILDALRSPALRQTTWFRSFGSIPERPANYDTLTKKEQETFDKTRDEAEAKAVADAKEHLQRKGYLRAGPIRGSTLITISLRGGDPGELPTVLGIIIDAYTDRLQRNAELQSTGLRATFFSEFKRAEDDLATIQNLQKQYVIENDIPNIQSQLNDAQIAYQLIAQQEAEMRVLKQRAMDTFRSMAESQKQGQLGPAPGDVAEVEKDPAIYNRDERIRQLREEREVALHRFGEHHYYVRDLDRKITAALQERKINFDRLVLERQQVNLSMAKSQVDQLEAQLAGLAPRLDEARLKMRDLTLKIKGYEDLVEKYKTAQERRDQASKALDDVRVQGGRPDALRVQRQQAPTEAEMTLPYKPWYTVPGVAFLVLGLTVGLIYLREMLDQRIKTPSDVKLLPKMELLGVLPDTTDDPSAPARVESVVQDDPAGLMAESFRQIRTAILTQMDRRGYKTLLLSCLQPQSGASTVASNLAMSMAYVGRRVLLIDANLRRPNQHAIFGIPQQPGLVELLRGSATLEQAVFHKVEPSVDILPAGDVRDVPPEMLEGGAFRGLLSQLERNYDLILIDSPPALLASDCQMLAKHVDAMILVLHAMSDKRGMVGRLLRQIEGQRADMLGVVLNRVLHSAGGYFRQTYEDFYRYRQIPSTSTPKLPAPQPTIKE